MKQITLAAALVLLSLPALAADPPQVPAANPFEQNIIDQFNALETVGRNAARVSGDAARAAQAYATQVVQLQAKVKDLEDKCGDKCKPPAPTAEAKPEPPAAPPQP